MSPCLAEALFGLGWAGDLDGEAGCCRFHGVTWGLVHNLPVWLTDAYLFKFHQMLRGKYLKKMAREAKKA